MKKNDSTNQVVSDREAIADVINKWAYYRDRDDWSQLRTTFHPEGTLSLCWFSGSLEQFIDSCGKVSEKDILVKHIMGTPVIRINGNRAVSEASAILMARDDNGPCEIDITSYNIILKLSRQLFGHLSFSTICPLVSL